MIGKLLRVVAAVVVLVGAALIGWRVLAPAEVLEPAAGAYPVAAAVAPGATGKTTLAPLIVDGRLRVYAGERLVKADGPVEAKTMFTARWSYRRWPERLTGMVAVADTVVTRWSDGDVVALDARTGRLAWRATGPGAEPFTGRTGSAAVWAPPGLHTAGTSVLITDGRRLIARAAADGAERWTTALPPNCAGGSASAVGSASVGGSVASGGSVSAGGPAAAGGSVSAGGSAAGGGSGDAGGFVTAGGRYVCGSGAWDVISGAAVQGWPTGPFTAVGCDVARSGCAGLRDGSGQGWLTGGRLPERAPALDAPNATASADLVLTSSGGAVVASRADRELWRWSGTAQVLGVRAGRAALLTTDRRLVVLNATTGTQRTAFPLYVPTERVEAWKPDRWQLTDSFLAMERLLPSAGTDPDEPNHFYTVDPVVIAAW